MKLQDPFLARKQGNSATSLQCLHTTPPDHISLLTSCRGELIGNKILTEG